MFSIVLVSYNSAGVIGEAIGSIPPGHEVIVVDNASADASVEVARTAGATVVELDENLGFGTACNRGAAVATNEKLLFLNPDAEVMPGSLDVLEAAFDRYPDAGAFNPRLLDADGSQFFRKRTKLARRPYLRRPPLPQADRRVVMLSGAALAVRKSVFDAIGGFDENIFLFYEDDDLSLRIMKAGHELYYIHDACVRHRPGSSSPPSDELTFFKEYHAMRAMRYACAKHKRPFWRWTRIAQEYWRSRASETGTPRQIRAAARLKALRE